MHIVVCIKQVPVVSAMQFDPETRTLRREGVPTEVSAFDARAVIKAVALKQELGGSVTVLTMGPPGARSALVDCLALGADRAIHLCDRAFAGSDTLATARALAAALVREPFDLVLCGRNSTDAETGQVGPELAELLDLPQVTGARTLTVDLAARRIHAERETDEGFETVSAPLPVLVTAAEDLAPERFASKAEKVAAAEKPIEEVAAAALGNDMDRFGAAGSPTRVAGLVSVEEQRRAQIIAGATLEASVDELVDRLLEHGLFGTWSVDGAGVEDRPLVPVRRAGAADVLVVAEASAAGVRRVTLELMGKAVELARSVGGAVVVLLAGAGVRAHTEILVAHGADRVLVADADVFGDRPTDTCAALLAQVIEREQPGIVLMPSTVFGRDVAPRVAARLGLGLTGDCIDLSLDDEGRLLQHKPAFGGKIVAPILSRTLPEMATVRPGMLPVGTGTTGRGEVRELSLPTVDDRVRVVARQPAAESSSALDHAAVVIGAGSGIGSKENLGIVQPLADVLGAAICTTRDVTDKGWLPKQYQVGLTGRAIAPKLYIAIAIRGAFEHVVGVRRAGLIVAINKNAKAPIFKSADYGVVADYAACVPLLVERFRTRRPA